MLQFLRRGGGACPTFCITNPPKSGYCNFSVYPWPLTSGQSGQPVIDVLRKNVELAGAQWSSGWCVDCETYQSVASMCRFSLCSF